MRKTGRPQTPEHVWEALKKTPEGNEIIITFPVSVHPHPILPPKGKGEVKDRARTQKEPEAGHGNSIGPDELGRMGFSRFFHEGQVKSIEEWNAPQGEELHVVADRLSYRSSERKRIMDSLEQAFRFGSGKLDVWINGLHLRFQQQP